MLWKLHNIRQYGINVPYDILEEPPEVFTMMRGGHITRTRKIISATSSFLFDAIDAGVRGHLYTRASMQSHVPPRVPRHGIPEHPAIECGSSFATCVVAIRLREGLREEQDKPNEKRKRRISVGRRGGAQAVGK
jgi:hypothetical protein